MKIKYAALLCTSLMLMSTQSFANSSLEYYCPSQVVCTGNQASSCKPVINGKTEDWGFWGIITSQLSQPGTYNLVMAKAKKDEPMPGDNYCWYTSSHDQVGFYVTTAMAALQAETNKGNWRCTNQVCYVASNPLNTHSAPFIVKNY